VSGRVVGDDGDRDPVAIELPGGEPCPLEEGTRLVGEYRHAATRFHRRAHHAERGTEARSGEGTGVAVGEDASAVGNQGQASFAEGATGGDVLVENHLGLTYQAIADRRHARTRCGDFLVDGVAHTTESPEQVHGRGPRAREPLDRCLEIHFQVGQVPGRAGDGAARDTQSRGTSDRRCAADRQ